MAGIEGAAQFEGGALPGELRDLLQTIASQIEAADHRHTDILEEMRERLAVLSLEAERVRDSVPLPVEDLFRRIEQGLADLGRRLDGGWDHHLADLDVRELPQLQVPGAAEDTLARAPAALRSATESFPDHPKDTNGRLAGIDTFDVIGDAELDLLEDLWSPRDAEALAQSYEEAEAALVHRAPDLGPQQPGQIPPPEDAAGSRIETSVEDVSFASPAARHAEPLDRATDREWLDQRMAEIAQRIEQSLAEIRPDSSITILGERFDALESKLAVVLEDVATRSDLDGLKTVEGHIAELAHHIEHAEAQLARLDAIEQQLIAVVQQLAEQRMAAAPEAFPAEDFREVATNAAEHVAQRLAATLQSRNGDDHPGEMAELLRSFIDERRLSDEQTFSLLDTVQQAMIRVLDRIDALEEQRAIESAMPHAYSRFEVGQHIADPGFAPSPVGRHDEPAPVIAATQAPAQPAPLEPELELERPQAATAMPGEIPVPVEATTAEATGPQSPIEKLRAEFIADAQRAKARAAAEQAAAEKAAAEAQAQAAATKGARRKSPKAQGASVKGATKPSRKLVLTAIALALVVAAGGGSLLLGSKKPSPPPGAPTATAPDTSEPFSIEPPSSAEGGSIPALPQYGVPVDGGDRSGAAAGGSSSRSGLDPSDLGTAATGETVIKKTADGRRIVGEPGIEGIVLQEGSRLPTPEELSFLRAEQQAALLSSHVGTSAARLSPAALMPEEVSRLTATRVSAGEGAAGTPLVPASLGSQEIVPHASAGPQAVTQRLDVSALSLPPATVGPLSLRLAAANGDPSAEFEVGARLAEGKGTEQNFKEALHWYQRAASRGFAQAQYRLGTLYERGLGTKPDLQRARQWYQRAAEQGNVKAMHNLAVLSAGRDSASPDYALAAQWFLSAAEHGLADSQFNLAVLRENGLGVVKDPAVAYKWYALAARGGDKEAAKRRDQLKAILGAAVLAEAEAAIAVFEPKRVDRLINDARAAGEDWKSRQAAEDRN